MQDVTGNDSDVEQPTSSFSLDVSDEDDNNLQMVIYQPPTTTTLNEALKDSTPEMPQDLPNQTVDTDWMEQDFPTNVVNKDNQGSTAELERNNHTQTANTNSPARSPSHNKVSSSTSSDQFIVKRRNPRPSSPSSKKFRHTSPPSTPSRQTSNSEPLSTAEAILNLHNSSPPFKEPSVDTNEPLRGNSPREISPTQLRGNQPSPNTPVTHHISIPQPS